jgi:hypothetical protein
MRKFVISVVITGIILLSGVAAYARGGHSYGYQGGHYAAGAGSSHKGGHYMNSRTGNHYTHHY